MFHLAGSQRQRSMLMLLCNGDNGVAVVGQLLRSRDPERALDNVISASLQHMCPLPVIRQLELGGTDLRRASVSRHVWFSARTSRTVPLLNGAGGSSRLTLAHIQRSLQTHVDELSELEAFANEYSHGCAFSISGQAISALFPNYLGRFSHDLDVMVPDLASAQELVEALCRRHSFRITWDRTTVINGAPVGDFLLDAEYGRGGRLHMDLYAGGIPADEKGAPALRLPHLLSRISFVNTQQGVRPLPSVEDLFVLLAHKIQRNGAFVFRSVADAEHLVSECFDLAYLADAISRNGLAPAVQWLRANVQSMPDELLPAAGAAARVEACAIRLAAYVPARPQQAGLALGTILRAPWRQRVAVGGYGGRAAV